VSAVETSLATGTPAKRRFLQPGQLVVSAAPMEITTILGSCVAVCLWDSQRRLGGMNHFMLPISGGNGASSARFGSVAMAELLDGVRAIGGRQPFLQARLFGGSCMFEHLRSTTHLGQQNVDLAVDFLMRNRIDILQNETGGNRGRKVTYRTDEGNACLISILMN
jgi:chemotaxis protein CheD